MFYSYNRLLPELPNEKIGEMGEVATMNAVIAFGVSVAILWLVLQVFGYNIVDSLIGYMLITVSISSNYSIRAYQRGFNKEFDMSKIENKMKFVRLVWLIGILPSCIGFLIMIVLFKIVGFDIVSRPYSMGGMIPMGITLPLSIRSYRLGYIASQKEDIS